MSKHKLTAEDRKKGAFRADNAVEMARRGNEAKALKKKQKLLFADYVKQWLDELAFDKAGKPIIARDGHQYTWREVLANRVQNAALNGKMDALKMVLESSGELPNQQQNINIQGVFIDSSKPITLVRPEERNDE